MSASKKTISEKRRDQTHDLKWFFMHLEMCKTRRICSVCGERRNLYEIPDKNRFDRENALFSALEDETREKFCYLPDDEDEDVYCCVSCFKDLKKRQRPVNAHKFPDVNEELACLTKMEMQCIRPVVPFLQIFHAFTKRNSKTQQYITKGSSCSIFNEVKDVIRRIPRRPKETDVILVRTKKAMLSEEDTRIRPRLLARLAKEMKENHVHGEYFDLNESYLDDIEAGADDLDTGVRVVEEPESEEDDDESESEEEEDGEEHRTELDEDEDDDEGEPLTFASAEPMFLHTEDDNDDELLRETLATLAVEENDIFPNLDAEHNQLVNEFEAEGFLMGLVFPQHFTNGRGTLEETEMTFLEFVRHCLYWHDGRFAQDPEFVAWCTKYLSLIHI